MKVVVWLIRGILFIALLGLAIKNSDSVDLRFFLGGSWQAPLSVIILAAFGAGILVGLLAALATMARQKRELRRLRKNADISAAEGAP